MLVGLLLALCPSISAFAPPSISTMTSVHTARAAPLRHPAIASSAGDEEPAYTAAAAAGLVANPVMWVSLSYVATTGAGLPAGPFGLVGAIEGISYLVVVGLAGASLYSKVTTGSGLPAGRGGLLGAAEGLSFLSIVAGIAVLALSPGTENCVPNALPIADYSDKVNVCK